MKKYFFLCTVILTFLACRENIKPLSGEELNVNNDSLSQYVSSGIDSLDNDDKVRKIKDVDTLSVSTNVAEITRTVGNNHFYMRIELPHYDNADVDRNILSWINQNLEQDIKDSLELAGNAGLSTDFDDFKTAYNQKFEGNPSDLNRLLQFYADKHFILYHGDRLGIEYNVECRKVFENKDIVSFEINEFFSNYAIMKTTNLVRGASFFKYNGKLLSWPYFEKSNVKNIVKKEINRQYLKFSQETYEEFLKTTRFREFSLPDNPPYMTRNGLKFIYRVNELSAKPQDGQIYCVIDPENLSLMASLIDMLK